MEALAHCPEDLLRNAVHDIVDALAVSGDPSPVHLRILSSLADGLGAQRAVLCLWDERSRGLVGAMGVGRGVESCHPHFLVPVDDSRNLFSVLCERGVDSCIDDATDPVIARRMPAWWRSHLGSRSFMVLPMLHQGRCIGMIYCDAPNRGALRADEASMKAVRTLRNQALLAWRMAH